MTSGAPHEHPRRDSAPHHDPRLLAVVFVGGCLGTSARAGLSTAFGTAHGDFPWTTLLINVIGAFLLGVLLDVLAVRGPDARVRRLVRLGLGTGVLGGFTTYSTFMVETTTLSLPTGIAYVLATVLLGSLAAAAGLRLARHPALAPAELRR